MYYMIPSRQQYLVISISSFDMSEPCHDWIIQDSQEKYILPFKPCTHPPESNGDPNFHFELWCFSSFSAGGKFFDIVWYMHCDGNGHECINCNCFGFLPDVLNFFMKFLRRIFWILFDICTDGRGHDCIIRSGRVMTLLSEPANSIPILMSLPPSDNKANIWNNIYPSAIELSISE